MWEERLDKKLRTSESEFREEIEFIRGGDGFQSTISWAGELQA